MFALLRPMGIKKLGVFSLLQLLTLSAFAFEYPENSLDWPVELAQDSYRLGPIMHQYQGVGTSYYHAGQDVVSYPGAEVRTPVSGVVDAGYYDYQDHSDGSATKIFLSLRDIDPNDLSPKLAGEAYFEVFVTDEHGNRFEFHHLDRHMLPPSIVEKIMGGGRVEAGELVGHIVSFPFPYTFYDRPYHHLHYNIITADDLYINPLYASRRIVDTAAPVISHGYVDVGRHCMKAPAFYVSPQHVQPEDHARFFVFRSSDDYGDNKYPHPPTKITAVFDDGSEFSLDFSQRIRAIGAADIDIHELYSGDFCFGPSTDPFKIPGSSNNTFYFKVPLPQGYRGGIHLTVEDYVGNQSIEEFVIGAD